ncbi:hypothetical protein Mpal_1276 [Methanosphaerula palustris E1-9c]|uniref:Uncharacterized protein n=1 Tax=Methanosphaerula palustris (strain ATCC BAA-1556 / DSM 19958 / E1-9c) TaxID=521011 RepID=B8GHK5_METPE|nr:hypothetical protein Mpal_1276 [Methanosphaerula palustris E1-9c]
MMHENDNERYNQKSEQNGRTLLREVTRITGRFFVSKIVVAKTTIQGYFKKEKS